MSEEKQTLFERKHLYLLRLKSNESLQELADCVGISRATLSRLERGKTSPSWHMIVKLAKYYKVPLSYFVKEDL